MIELWGWICLFLVDCGLDLKLVSERKTYNVPSRLRFVFETCKWKKDTNVNKTNRYFWFWGKRPLGDCLRLSSLSCGCVVCPLSYFFLPSPLFLLSFFLHVLFTFLSLFSLFLLLFLSIFLPLNLFAFSLFDSFLYLLFFFSSTFSLFIFLSVLLTFSVWVYCFAFLLCFLSLDILLLFFFYLFLLVVSLLH